MISYIYGMRFKIDKFTANPVFPAVIILLIFLSSALYAEVGVPETLRMMKSLGFIEVHDLSGGWSQNAAGLPALDSE